MRERVYEKDKQTSFAKNHSVLGSKCLLTDIDAIQSTENEFYTLYSCAHLFIIYYIL